MSSEKKQELVTGEMRRLFMEIGLMGFGSGYEPEAIAFFSKLRVADPQAAYPLIALAFIYIILRQPDEAEQLLLELELSPHGQDPYVVKWIQSLRKAGDGIL